MRQLLHSCVDRLARRVLLPEDGFCVPLSPTPSSGCPCAVVYAEPLWRERHLSDKLRSLVTRRWSPEPADVMRAARQIFLDEVFGGEEDLGDILFDLMTEHWRTAWTFPELSDHDTKRAASLRACNVATYQKFRGIQGSPPLNLAFLRRAPVLTLVVVPMLSKIPVVSLRYFVDIHAEFAFNEIKAARHPHADALVSLLYETLFLQHKTALTLLEFASCASRVGQHKREALIVHDELSAIMRADVLFAYLKATIEKALSLLGHTYEIHLDDKQNHKKRLAALLAALPDYARKTPYAEFLLSSVSADALDELNAFRTGILHKKGIAELQPHSYLRTPGDRNPFPALFETLHEQHFRNSAILIAVLAMLTDDLVRRKPPKNVAEPAERNQETREPGHAESAPITTAV